MERHARRLAVLVAGIAFFCVCQRSETPPTPVVDRPPRKLADTDPVRLVEMLEYRDDDRDAEKRFAAIMIGITRELSAIELLNEKLLTDRSPPVRAACAYAIGEMADASSLPALRKALKDGAAAVRAAAIDALGRYRDPQALAYLKELAEEGRGPEALMAFRAIASREDPARAELLSRLSPGSLSRFLSPGEPYRPAIGKTWYVDASSGDDGQAGDESRPFGSLSRAIKELRAGAGDRVFATSGKDGIAFRESVRIPPELSGTRSSPTVLAAWPGRPPPVLDGADPKTPDEPNLEDGIYVSASFVLVDGFVVRHFRDSGVELNGGTGSVVANCVVEKCDRHGIFLYYAPAGTILNARVSHCNYQGISIRSSPRAAILGGSSNHNGIDGLLFLWDSDDVLVDGFSATGNRRGVGFIRGSQNGRILRSVLEGNSEVDLAVEADSSTQVLLSKIGKFR